MLLQYPLMQKAVIGIDFGTTNTVAAVIDRAQNKAMVLPLDPNYSNPNILRSIIYFTKDGRKLFGAEAVNQYNFDVANQAAARKETIKTGKFIKITSDPSSKSGYKPDKIVEEVYEADVTNVGRLLQGVKSLLGKEHLKTITIFNDKYTVEEIVAIFLSEVRERLSAALNEEVTRAVIGRPVTFVGENDELAEKQLRNAGRMAGFTEVELQLEPIGAAYDFSASTTKPQKVLVFDFGGGTLDLSVVTFPNQKVIANHGIPLGGDLINSRIFLEAVASYFGRGERYGLNQLPIPENIYRRLQNWFSISLLKTESFASSLENFSYKNTDPQSLENLRALVFSNLGFKLYEEIDRVKKTLSKTDQATLRFEMSESFIEEQLLRPELENIIAEDLENIESLISKSLDDAGLKASDIDVVAMTGGSSLIPAVQDILARRFGREKLKANDTFTSVAAGLALYADRPWRS